MPRRLHWQACKAGQRLVEPESLDVGGHGIDGVGSANEIAARPTVRSFSGRGK